MKILLVGELSGFHNNLKKGLCSHGYEVTIAGTGDGWKKLPVDIDFSISNEKLYNKLYRSILPIVKINQLSNFNIVQFATPLLFNPNVNSLIYKLIDKANNSNSYLCGISSNDPYYLETTKHLEYSPYQDFDDNVIERYYPIFSKKDVNSHRDIISLVKGVIPSCYDYEYGYKYNNYTKLKKIIPFPFDVESVPFIGIRKRNKIKIFHGVSRAKNKGSKYIIDAMKMIENTFGDLAEIQIVEKVPYNQYTDLLNDSHIIIDQCLSYSYGINALIGLSKGKIVLSGAEPIAIKSLDISAECPVINIKPNVDQIYNVLSKLIQSKNLTELGEQSRKYVEQNHSADLIAQKYIQTWQK